MLLQNVYTATWQERMMKIRKSKAIAIVLLGYAATSGCTWVDPIPGASSVTLVTPAHVSNCKSVGTTISQVKAKIGIINRNDEKVAGELLTLAQNSAVEVGGDTLVAEGTPSEGTQKFRIYKCR
jgi:MinD superfamily P-loop ATPase